MKNLYEIKLSNRQNQLMLYSKSLIDVLNELDDNNAYKDTKRYYGLLADSHFFRSKIDLLHREIKFLEIKLRGEKDED